MQRVLDWVAEQPRPLAAFGAARGAEVALLGAAMPGTPRRRGGSAGRPWRAVPDVSWRPRRPGRRVRVSAGAGRDGGGAAGAATRSRAAEPRAGGRSVPWRRAGGELARARHAVLARIEWPGKPGAAAPVAPLTADEQQRFDAGQQVYKNICQACHQPDGRGQESWPRASSDRRSRSRRRQVPSRILLNGKEGPVGLMPPLGLDAQRRTDRGGAHLHPARMGPGRNARHHRHRHRDACPHPRPAASMDQRRAARDRTQITALTCAGGFFSS